MSAQMIAPDSPIPVVSAPVIFVLGPLAGQTLSLPADRHGYKIRIKVGSAPTDFHYHSVLYGIKQPPRFATFMLPHTALNVVDDSAARLAAVRAAAAEHGLELEF